MTLRVIELFAGVGSQRMALRNLGIDHEVVAISEIDKHALASYEAIHGDCPNLGDITKVESLPPCDLVTYSFPCLTGDTLVKTIDGWERIDGLDRPKRVWTKDGWKMATASVQTGFKEVIDIETMMGHRISATHEHRFWARRRVCPWDNDRSMNIRTFEEPEWVEAKDLTTAHYLGYKVPDEEPIPYYGGLTQKYKDGRIYQRNALGPMMETEGFWWTVGRYVADGYVRTDGNVVLCIGYSKEADLDLIPLKFTASKELTVIKAIVTSVEFGAFCERFGRGAENKCIPPEFHALPQNLAKAMLEGYLSGDGHFDSEKGQWSITTVSKDLALDIAGLVAYVYHRPSSIYKTEPFPTKSIEGREVRQRTQYTVRFHTDDRKQDKAFYEDGWVWFPIRRLTVSGRAEPVYDISVEDSHSFTANGVTVHNCQDLSLAGKRKGMAEGAGTRSGLVWEVLRLLEGMDERPEWLLMENVPQVLTAPEWPTLIGRLEAMGYRNKWAKLDSSEFGSAQKRVRAFMVSRLGEDPPDLPTSAPEAPVRVLRDIMEPTRGEKHIKRIPLERIRWRTPKEEYRHPQSEGLVYPLVDATDSRLEGRRIASERSLCPTLTRGRPQKVVSEDEEERVVPLVETIDNLRMAKGRSIETVPKESTPVASIEGETCQIKVVADFEGKEWKMWRRIYSDESLSPTIPHRLNNQQTSIKVVADWDRPQLHDICNRIYDIDGLSPTATTHTGGNHEIKVIAEDTYRAYASSANILGANGLSPTLRSQVHGLQNQPKVGTEIEWEPSDDPSEAVPMMGEGDTVSMLTPRRKDKRQNGRRFKDPGEPAFTVTCQDHNGAASVDGGHLVVNILTPKECWRLMGFSDEDYAKAERVCSETQLYNQAGNSIVVEVLMAIFRTMFLDGGAGHEEGTGVPPRSLEAWL